MDGNLGMTPSQDLPLEGQIRAIGGGGGGAGGGVVDLLAGAGGCRETASSVVGSVSTEWTDEKHSLYLNSMEESFVNQLYNHEFCFNNLFSWTSRISEDAGTPVSQIRHLCSGQFKVLHGGFWGEVKFERPQTQADIQKESHLLSRSPWIRRFMSTPRDKEAELSTAEHMGGYPAVKTEIYVTGQRHNDGECRETAHMSQLYACSTHPCPLDSVGIDTEVSDQNFVDVSVGAKQSTRIRKRKRSRTTSSNVNVQDASFGETPATSNGDESLADATCSGTEEANL